MKILFLDQSGKLGGAELSLLDLATAHREQSTVGLFADGPFRQALEARHIPVQVLNQHPINVRKEAGLLSGIMSTGALFALVRQVTKIAQAHDLIYANTQKALIVGSIVSLLTQKPLIYHLRDILSLEHFSPSNRKIAVTIANLFVDRVIANSQATRDAFIQAGGNANIIEVVYNGFQPEQYISSTPDNPTTVKLKQQLGLEEKFVIGHFSRLSPWKGQHILIEALQHCPPNTVALFVGDALFGETDYVQKIQAQVQQLGLAHRIQFLGFRDDVPQLMTACDLIAHTSIAPEPFGRVIIEAMLCGTPIVAANAGGAMELIEHNQTGWLSQPGNPTELAHCIQTCYYQPPAERQALIDRARRFSQHHFHLKTMHQKISELLRPLVKSFAAS
jgi:glycosyltransferase involved in cell wall biosynthesis